MLNTVSTITIAHKSQEPHPSLFYLKILFWSPKAVCHTYFTLFPFSPHPRQWEDVIDMTLAEKERGGFHVFVTVTMETAVHQIGSSANQTVRMWHDTTAGDTHMNNVIT